MNIKDQLRISIAEDYSILHPSDTDRLNETIFKALQNKHTPQEIEKSISELIDELHDIDKLSEDLLDLIDQKMSTVLETMLWFKENKLIKF